MADSQLERPLCDGTGAVTRQTERCLLLSHGANLLGSKAWEFAMPLLLVRLSGGRLIAPAVLGMATTAAETFLGPAVGERTDRAQSRLATVAAAAGAQAAATLATLLLLLVALYVGCGGQVDPEGADPVWFAGHQPVLGGTFFVCICVCGVVEVLGRLASSVSIERDWVPTAFEAHGETVLGRVNARMANVDLIAEILGPLLAGLFFSVAPSSLLGFAAVALLNVLSFLPQFLLLSATQQRCAELRAPRPTPAGAEGSDAAKGGEGAWAAFLGHPSGVPLLTLAYVLLFFTVLSSHDVVLTAYLAQVGLDPILLSSFRALGAAAGVFGASTFELLGARCGSVRQVAGAFVGLQTAAVFIAAASMTFDIGGTGLAPGWLGHTPWHIIPFLLAIVVSRIGLYGFDVGFSTLSQGLVDERRRGSVGAVTEGLCAFAQLCMYAMTSAVTGGGSTGFGCLVWASAGSVGAAAGTFALWRGLYHEHEHFHSLEGGAEAGHGHGHSHGAGHGHEHGQGAEDVHKHSHTSQQLRALREDGLHGQLRKHRHVHYHGPRLPC